ncbi:penicillin-binding transpeptidase domain-containing protein [Lentibacillus sp. CBA3610]|uniref:penicillin-binding transpeptidase domain-containing protein n=1 Tax=Lentibacillus sp. CBA3610 TaxID=2518176 RepID=UPI00159533E9|nr:penicillin-binding transpeptidase domain-containing protein [Lentibacillus sp. CBA3610]QKY69959.1 penicillin-binding transpeptidase domain-containing protein [Lentibacillus sp. CBA3610]
MKKIALLFPFLLLFLITACSNDETTPQERFNEYVNHWNNQEFSDMYNMITTESAETYPTEEFVDRYQTIYGDLNISNLQVTFEQLSDEEMEAAMDNGTAQFPFTVEMESIAGPISFDYEATLTKEEETSGEDGEAEENWFVKWDPGFIFPEIQDSGEIGLQITEPKRGEILDRNRMPLAINDTVHEVGIIPENLGDNPEQVKQEVADLIGMSVEEIDNSLNQDWVQPNMFVPLKKLPPSDEDTINQLSELSGVTFNDATGRVYPLGEAASHLTGYISQVTAEDLEELDEEKYDGDDMIGQRGLESLFEERLKGEEGAVITAVNESDEETVIAEKEVENGENIVTTIDADVQETIYESYDDNAGTAAAIHPKTGETLALVSSPGFVPDDFLYGISQSKYDELQNDPQQPTLNRFSATFSPGSAIKPVTAAIGLNNGSIVPGEGMEINGLTWSNGEGWGDYEVRRVSETDSPVDVTDALIRSDNIYFAKKAVEMGTEEFVNGMQQFGFGEDLPFEYPMTSSSVSSSGSIDDEVQLANTSYGQGEIEVSALHLALTYTPILNEGNMLKPTLLADEENGQIWKEELITSDEATLIHDALHDVVNAPDGTAKGAQDAEFPIAGKTGTAELKLSAEDEDGEENGWFVGYPSEDQDILIAMMVENTQDSGGSGYTVEKVTDVLTEIK